jgi:hypothetical protein
MPFFPDCLERLILVLNDLNDQLAEPLPRLSQDAAPGRCGPIIPPSLPADDFGVAAQIPKPLEQVEGWIKRSLAEPITVADEFFGDLSAVHRLFGRMVQDVQANEAVEEVSRNRIVGHNVFFRCRIPT